MPVASPRTLHQHTFPVSIVSNSNLGKYQHSPMYHQLIEYLQGGEAKMEEMKVPKNRRRAVRYKAKSFRLPSHSERKHLRYIETTGASSICIIEEEIPRFLRAAHEDHGHYAAALTLDYLMGRVYWPTRTKDVHTWCASCHSCQSRLRKPIKSVPLAIQGFSPMTMLGADWLGPISPACTQLPACSLSWISLADSSGRKPTGSIPPTRPLICSGNVLHRFSDGRRCFIQIIDRTS